MELIVGGLIVTQIVSMYYTSKDRKALLNAVVANSPHEYQLLQATPKRKPRKVAPLQDDANVPYGL